MTRQEEEVDPEDEADFEREYAKMMAESLESRKFERKQLFDVPIPVRPKNREASSSAEPVNNEPVPGNTMAFALLTKKGNRQQVRTMKVMSTSWYINTRTDTYRRATIGFNICYCHEESAAG